MVNLLKTITRHLVGVIMAAISTVLISILTGIGFTSTEVAGTMDNVESILTVTILAGFYALYEKALKPLFSKWFGELPDLPPPGTGTTGS